MCSIKIIDFIMRGAYKNQKKVMNIQIISENLNELGVA
ncbi:MAG: hypothetical protein K0R06_761 [Clostridium sp.]|jgi:hypothetical protein|nr:hypothetical protein [Clostridium sp.]